MIKIKQVSNHKTTIAIVWFISILISSVVASAVGFYFSKIGELETRQFQNDKEILIDSISNVYKYESVYNLDIKELSNRKYSSYTCSSDIPLPSKVDVSHEDICEVRDILFNMKLDFNKSTIKARIIGSDRIIKALENIEKGFDEVSIFYYSNPVYTRDFPDAYEKIMPSKFYDLQQIFTEELKH